MKVRTVASLLIASILLTVGAGIVSWAHNELENSRDYQVLTIDTLVKETRLTGPSAKEFFQGEFHGDLFTASIYTIFGLISFGVGLFLSSNACKTLSWSVSRVGFVYLTLAGFLMVLVLWKAGIDPQMTVALVEFVSLISVGALFFLLPTPGLPYREAAPESGPLIGTPSTASAEVKRGELSVTSRLLLFLFLAGLSLGASYFIFKDEAHRLYAFMVLLCLGLLVAGVVSGETLFRLLPTIKFGKD